MKFLYSDLFIYLFESTLYLQKSLLDSPLFESLFCDDIYIYIYGGVYSGDRLGGNYSGCNYSFCGVVGFFRFMVRVKIGYRKGQQSFVLVIMSGIRQ